MFDLTRRHFLTKAPAGAVAVVVGVFVAPLAMIPTRAPLRKRTRRIRAPQRAPDLGAAGGG